MNLLVTGGAGFIGSHVVRILQANGHSVSVLDNLRTGKKANLPPDTPLIQKDIGGTNLDEEFTKGGFDTVFHLAAQGSVPFSVHDPIEDAKINVLGFLNILNLCVKHKVRKVVFSSSGGTIYGAAPSWPAVETMPYSALSPYGVTKVCAELYLPLYQQFHGLTYTALRYSNVYGPRQDPFGEAGVVAIFTNKMLRGEQPTINGDGSHVRDYVYVGDVARANFLALSKGDNEGVNIGTGRETTNSELYEAIRKAVNYPNPAVHGPERPGDLRRNSLNPAKAQKVLGWVPEVSLEEGLATTVAFFRG